MAPACGPNPTHSHDDVAVASCELEFDGETFAYEMHTVGYTGSYYWHGLGVIARDEPRPLRSDQAATWIAAKASFARFWEGHCDYRRSAMAVEAHAKAQLLADGVTYGVVKLTTLGVGGPSQAVVPLSPEFDADTLAYTATTSFANVAMLALASEGATVSWTVGEASVEGGIASVDLEAGANVITITVSRSEYTSTVYTLTITRR